MKRFLTDFLRTWLVLLWDLFGPIVLFVGFMFGMLSESPWIYHPTLMITLLRPAFFMARHAITGRSARSGWSVRVTNSFGTGFLLLSAAIFFLGYCYAVYDKTRG